MEISVVIPFLNEEESLPILHEKLVHQLDEIGKSWEIIYVNDGSSDNSFSVISEICKQSEKARVVGFRRNRGKSEALNCGFAEANGEFIITMDADLQDDPNEIPNLLTEIEKGFDMVSGWKENRKDPLEKRFASKIFNKVTQWSTGLKIHDFNCGLKIYRKEVVKTLKIYGSLHRFIPAMAHQAGFKVGEIPVKHYPREHGVSKFGWRRYPQGLFDLMTILFIGKYLQHPLHFFGVFGFISFLIGCAIEIGVLILKYGFDEPFGRHLAMLVFGVMMIIIGVQFISLGLLGELIVHRSTRDRE